MQTLTVSIEVLGRLWMPMCKVGQRNTINLGEGPWCVDIEPTADAVEDWLTANTGDFSEVIDWQAELVIEDTIQRDNASTTFTTWEYLKEWDSEENEFAFAECFQKGE